MPGWIPGLDIPELGPLTPEELEIESTVDANGSYASSQGTSDVNVARTRSESEIDQAIAIEYASGRSDAFTTSDANRDEVVDNIFGDGELATEDWLRMS